MKKSNESPEKEFADAYKVSSIKIQSSTQATEDGEKLEIKKNSNSTPEQSEYTHPHRLLSLLYQLELSTLSLFRISLSKNSSNPVIFRNSLDGQFNNIVLNFNKTNFCIKVQYVDTHYSQKCLDYKSFFSPIEGKFNIRKYLNEFAAELIKHSDSDALVPRYLILYTNANLDITKSGKFKQTKDIFKPQLSVVTPTTDGNLHKFFKSGGKFYRFADDEETREFLADLVTFNLQIRGKMKKKGFRSEEVRRVFFDRLILAVNQAKLEEISDTVRREMKKSDDSLRRGEVLAQLIEEGEEENIEGCEHLRSMLYSFNLFVFSTHAMFLDENIHSIRFEERAHSHTILMEVNDKILQIRALEIDLNRFSLQEFAKQRGIFSIDAYFDNYVRKGLKNTDYYVIYTNVGLPLLKELIIGNNVDLTKYDPTEGPQFTEINKADEMYSTLKHLNVKNLYKFTLGEAKNWPFLKVPKCGRRKSFANVGEGGLMRKFLESMVFVVKQPACDEMHKRIVDDLKNTPKVPYDYGKLCKIVLLYLQSHEYGKLTKELMTEIFDLEKKKRIEINDEVEFAKRVLTADMPEYGEFIDFLIRGNGKYYLDILRRNEVNVSSIAKIIEGTKSHEVIKTFTDLCNVCFDHEGNKTNVVKNFEKKGLPINLLSKMLRCSGSDAPKTLRDLHDLWFDDSGNPTNYWKPLENEAVINQIPLLFYNAGADCVGRLKAFSNFWFHPNGTKTQCLKNLEDNRMSLSLVCGVLTKSGEGCFQKFYQLWFDESGRKTIRFKQLEEEGVTALQVCKVLRRTGKKAIEAFDKLYSIWFNESGLKTHYSLTLTAENVHFSDIVDILPKTGMNALEIFKNLYVHWFQNDGTKTQYLKILEAKGIDVPKVCKHLSAAGPQSIDKFKILVNSYDPLCQWNIKTQTAGREEVRDKILESDKKGEEERNTTLLRNLKKMKIESKGEEKIKERTLDVENTGTILMKENDSSYELSSDDETNDINFPVSKIDARVQLEYFLQSADGMKYSHVLQKNKLRVKKLSKIFQNTASSLELIKAFKKLYNLLFNESGEKRTFLKAVSREKINLNHIIRILNGSGIYAANECEKLQTLLFDTAGNKTCHFGNFEKIGMTIQWIGAVFKGSGYCITENIKQFHDIFFHSDGTETKCLTILQTEQISFKSLFRILQATGNDTKQTFQNLYNFWFDSRGDKTKFLKNLEKNQIHLPLIIKLLHKSGKSAPKVFENVYDFIFDEMENKRHYIRDLEKDVEINQLLDIVRGHSFNPANLIKLYDLWYDANGNKSNNLLLLEENGINLNCLTRALKDASSQAAIIFQSLINFLFDEQGNKTKEMQNIEKVIELREVFEMIINGNKRNRYFTLVNLYKLWFDDEGNKTNELLILEKNNMTLTDVSRQLSESRGHVITNFQKFTKSLSEKSEKETIS